MRNAEREDGSCFAIAEMTWSSSSERGLALIGSDSLPFAAVSSVTSVLCSVVTSLDSRRTVNGAGATRTGDRLTLFKTFIEVLAKEKEETRCAASNRTAEFRTLILLISYKYSSGVCIGVVNALLLYN